MNLVRKLLKKHWFTLGFIFISLLAAFFRFYRLNQLPPALYWEEAALGYDAYSILKTGRDHHGQLRPIVAFKSFGDYKPALYFYTIVPFIKIFGLSAWAVRFPATLSGVGIVLGVGYLSRFLTKKRRDKKILQLLTMFLTAVSPWAVQFSRAGWEVNLATLLILWGLSLFLTASMQLNQEKESQKSSILFHLLGGVTLLVLSTYTYHSARLIAPLLGLMLSLHWFLKHRFKYWRSWLFATILAVILSWPLLTALKDSSTTQRFAETSLFSDLNLIEESNARKEAANYSLASRLIYHRYTLFGREIVSNFLDHFRLDFLILSGDGNPRHSTQIVGTFYHLEIIFLLLGSYFLWQKKNEQRWILSFWLVIGILPAALTKTTPHALRILPTLPVWLIIIGYGLKELVNIIEIRKELFIGFIALIYLAEISLFWRFYTQVYPQLYGQEWQVGAAAYIEEIEQQKNLEPNQVVRFADKFGRTMMFYWFYTQTDPTEVQAEAESVKKDQGEFLEFQNLELY